MIWSLPESMNFRFRNENPNFMWLRSCVNALTCWVCPPRWDQGPTAMNVILCNESALICCQMLGKHVTIYIMTSKAITIFNQWQLRPLVCMASPLTLFWVVLQRNLLICLATPGSASGSTSVCPWLWSVETLPAYWPVRKFDLILPVIFLVAFNVLTPITAYHLPLYQCVAIAFWILVLSVRFIVPSVVQCYLVHWLNILSIT